MAAIHVIDQIALGQWNVLLHFTTPSGNNSAGVSWKAAGLAVGALGGTPSPHGNPDEAAAIEAGDIVELKTSIPLDPTKATIAQLQASLDALALQEKTSWIKEMQATLRYYGYKRGTV